MACGFQCNGAEMAFAGHPCQNFPDGRSTLSTAAFPQVLDVGQKGAYLAWSATGPIAVHYRSPGDCRIWSRPVLGTKQLRDMKTEGLMVRARLPERGIHRCLPGVVEQEAVWVPEESRQRSRV